MKWPDHVKGMRWAINFLFLFDEEAKPQARMLPKKSIPAEKGKIGEMKSVYS